MRLSESQKRALKRIQTSGSGFVYDIYISRGNFRRTVDSLIKHGLVERSVLRRLQLTEKGKEHL